MKLIINTLFIALFMSSCFLQAQEAKANDFITEKHSTIIFELGFLYPEVIGNDNFAGLGLSPKSGINLRIQANIYKGFYLGGAINSSTLNNVNKPLLGNYSRTTKETPYLFAGYELYISQKWRTSLDLGFGNTTFRTTIPSMGSGRNGRLVDNGRSFLISLNLEYVLNDFLSVYSTMSYENIRTDIVTSPEFQSQFEQARFLNLGIGLRFRGGNKSIVKMIQETEKAEKNPKTKEERKARLKKRFEDRKKKNEERDKLRN